MSSVEVSLHDIVKIRRRSQRKKFEATKSSTGNTFYTMRFCFESEAGTRFYINCFADEKESLKIWGDKDL